MYLIVRLIALGLAILLSGCGSLTSMFDAVIPDQRKDYTKARTLPDLSIPPGLTSGAIRDKMSIPEETTEGDRTYSDFKDRHASREGRNKDNEKDISGGIRGRNVSVAEVSVIDDQHVLVVEADRYELWHTLKKFWQSEGYQLELDDADLGVLETTWLETENKLNRDRYKIFAEMGKNKETTIVFLSHQGQELVTVDQAYGEDYEWSESVRDGKKEAAIVERLRSSLESFSNAFVSSGDDDSDKNLKESESAYDPTGKFAQRMQGRGRFGFSSDQANNDRNIKKDESERVARSEAVELRELKGSDLDAEGSASGMEEGGVENISDTQSKPRTRKSVEFSVPIEPTSVKMVSVGRGKYYLTVESGFNGAWKSTKRALEVANVSVRRADKGRGVFVVDLVEGAAGDSNNWRRLRFWKSNKPAQYQVSVTGIGNKTEIVILDPDGRWITSHEAERLLDRIYNALVSEAV